MILSTFATLPLITYENYSSYYRIIKKNLTARPPAYQQGLPADDGATAGHGVVTAEVFRWADSRGNQNPTVVFIDSKTYRNLGYSVNPIKLAN